MSRRTRNLSLVGPESLEGRNLMSTLSPSVALGQAEVRGYVVDWTVARTSDSQPDAAGTTTLLSARSRPPESV